MLRSLATPPATSTRPTVFKRSSATPPATPTRPMVLKRSLTTPRRPQHGHGYQALFPTPPANNTATGGRALDNTTGDDNMANGFEALGSNTTGGANTAIGYLALIGNTTGSNNTALGASAGNGVTTANNVICIGANVARCEREQHHLDWQRLWREHTKRHTAPVVVSDNGSWAQSRPRSGSKKTLPPWKKPVKQFCHSDRSRSTTRRTPKARRNLV